MRKRTDFNFVKKSTSNNDVVTFNNTTMHEELPEAGWFKGIISKVRQKGSTYIVSAKVYDFSGEHYYGEMNGFITDDYLEGDITDSFMQTFNNPQSGAEVIGKKAKVYVDFHESSDGYIYENIEEFAVL